LWAVAHAPQPLREILEIRFQVAPVLLLGHAINPHRPVCGQCFEAGAQVLHIADVMIQAGEDQLWITACLLTYPLQLCAHYSTTPRIVTVFPLQRSIKREDLHSEGITPHHR